jgi:agmatinase
MNSNFGDIPKNFSGYRKSKIIILPVPFDKTSSWIKGADKGPKAIIKASANLELYDIETKSQIYKKGIFTAKAILTTSSSKMVTAVYDKVKTFLNDKKFVVTLGGEHSVSIGAVKAHADVFSNMSVLHLDAHIDRRNMYKGDRYNHACVMARIKETVKETVSVGIRSMDYSESKAIDPEEVFYAGNIRNSKTWMKLAIRRLTKNVYITLDLDVFDPAVIPSTGTPEPGGLDWYQVTEFLKVLSEHRNIIGFDIVELCPSQNKASDYTAAKLIYKLLSYKFYKFVFT